MKAKPDHFECAIVYLKVTKRLLLNGGYVNSDRDQHLASRIEELIKQCEDSKSFYNEFGNLKDE